MLRSQPPHHGGPDKQGTALNNARIVPDVVDHINMDDAVSMRIQYGDRIVVNGNELVPAEASKEPHIEILGDGMFTLLMVDPDAPSPEDPKFAEFLHWVVDDIPNGALPQGEWGHGRVIVPYTGPTPPIGTHRYVFLLYHNPKDMPLGDIGPKVNGPEDRKNFSAKKFAAEYGLGDPIRVEWFLSSAGK